MRRGGIMCEGIVRKSELVVWTGSTPMECCAICREAFQVGVDICRVLDCTHVFHAKCIDLWFVKASSCPLCKNDLKICGRNTSSQRSLGRSSQSSSQMSLGSASLRSGQILVGHSNSDPALLRTLHAEALLGWRSQTPDRHVSSTPSLQTHERSMEVISISRSERSILSESSSGLLPAVQEGSEEARLEESNRMDSSNPNSARTNGGRTSSSGRDSTSPRSRSIQFQVLDEEDEDDAPGDRQATEEKAITWRIFTPEQDGFASTCNSLVIDGSEAVKGWNEEHPQCAIAAGHVVVEANGARTPGQMLEHFRQDKVVYLLINRQPTAQQAQVLRTALAIHQWSQTVDELLEDVVMDVVETCAICQEDLGTSEVKVPCGHHFHRTCIKEWFVSQSKARCPLCNQVFRVS
ncbi:Protein goliath (Protein g1) [Durusdinium trenchii]|uniref:Protein goliath (Protein g1) n=1 Tax=Durusdinium trenchii TaxID=1381693 RepID=A0ABP0I2D8_9DINO